jgi:hypothetical protein
MAKYEVLCSRNSLIAFEIEASSAAEAKKIADEAFHDGSVNYEDVETTSFEVLESYKLDEEEDT